MSLTYCPNCQQNVAPSKDFSWVGFVFGFGLFYLAYYMLLKKERCPMCKTTSFMPKQM
jgi:RNA polymerase subunit RPABC4/transcription elongation factor Spt4